MELESQKLKFHVDATWTPLCFKLEPLRLGLLKVKPSLRGSSFKALCFWQWSCLVGYCLVVWSCQMLCLFWDVFREYIRLALATKTSFRPFWTSFVYFGTYSMNIRLTIKSSHTTFRCREYFDWTQLSHLQQLQS